MKLQEIKKNIEAARYYRHSTTGMYRELMDEFRSHKVEISRNKDLSASGKQKATDRIRAIYEVKSMRLFEGLKTLHDNSANAAKSEAEKLLLSELPAVDKTTQSLFNMRMEELEAKVKFAISPNQAKEAIEMLAEAADHPALAAQAKAKIMELSSEVIGLTSGKEQQLALKHELGHLYDNVAARAMPEGAAEAMEAVGIANALLQAGMIKPVVEESIVEISKDAQRYVKDTAAYFEERANFVKEVEKNEVI